MAGTLISLPDKVNTHNLQRFLYIFPDIHGMGITFCPCDHNLGRLATRLRPLDPAADLRGVLRTCQGGKPLADVAHRSGPHWSPYRDLL